jgi:hypothetical protein
MQHRDIFFFNFKTQLAIIRVFRFINCFPFLIFRKTKGSIWNKFYIKDVYWNKFNIKIVNMSSVLRCLIYCQFILTIFTTNFITTLLGIFPPEIGKKKSLFHIGTGAERPQKHSRKITDSTNIIKPGTSPVYWVAWFVESGMYWTAIKLQKNER